MKLKISDNLSLPIDAATKTFGIVGKKRSGKTSTAMVLCEEFLKRKIAPVIVDPLDACWGLKAGKDGDPAGGYPIYVFGGDHADVPLEPTSGKLIADLIVDEHPPMILSLRHFESDAAQGRFVTDLAKQLLKRNREPVPIVFDEADKFAPQNPYPGEREMLGAVDRLVRHGGKDGLGITLITQRPALINKNVLNQVDTLIFMQLVGSTDVDAIENWIKRRGTKEEREAILSSLASLQPGEGWFWSPGWLEILKRVRFRQRETFDSARTPKVGEKLSAPKELARVDVMSLGDKIAATVERAKADDPKALRAKIAELMKKVADLEKRPPADAKVERVEVQVAFVPPEVKSAIAEMRRTAEEMRDGTIGYFNAVSARYGLLERELAKSLPHQPQKPVDKGPAGGRVSVAPTSGLPLNIPKGPMSGRGMAIEPVGRAVAASELGKGERKILAVVAQYPDGVTRDQLTVNTGYKRSSRDTYIQRLRAAGHVDSVGDRIVITAAGKIYLGDDYEILPTGQALLEYWLQRLPAGESKVLERVARAYPSPLDRNTLTEDTGYLRSSRDTYIQRLRSRRLVEIAGGGVKASDTLF